MNDHTFNARIADLETTISELPPEDRERLMEMSQEKRVLGNSKFLLKENFRCKQEWTDPLS